MRAVIALALCLLGGDVHTARADASGPLVSLRWLEGRWIGEGEGPDGGHQLYREIVCALQCRYLNVETRVLGTADADPHAPRGNLLSMWGWHPGLQRLVLHHFDDFAAVTTYVEQPQSDPTRRVFLHEDRRTRTRLRLTVAFQPPDAWRERYEWAAEGGAWEVRAERWYRRAPAGGLPGSGSIG